jgi:hypothetical protein
VLRDEPYFVGHLLSTELYRRLNEPSWVFDDRLLWAGRYAVFMQNCATRPESVPECC